MPRLPIPQSREQARENIEFLLSQEATHENRVEYLRSRPIQEAAPEELLGYRDVLWERRRQAEFSMADLDVAGTGGLRRPRYNVSTTVAFILAALGVRVAKHGNRGSVKTNGSFDLLSTLGFSIPLFTANAPTHLQTKGLAFLFARDWHPVLGTMAPARAEAGMPTVFNLLGPLMNPSSPRYQLVGCTNPTVAPIIAETLYRLGKQAIVVCGADGLDEVTTTGETYLYHVSPQGVKAATFHPTELDIDLYPDNEIDIGSEEGNATTFAQIIIGQGPKHLMDLVILNGAFALHLSGNSESLQHGRDTVQSALASGKVKDFFDDFRAFASQEAIAS